MTPVRTLPGGLGSRLDAAAARGKIRSGVSARDILRAVGNLCLPADDVGPAYSQRMVALLIDGLRYGADTSQLVRQPPVGL
jgi:hypothetical protein